VYFASTISFVEPVPGKEAYNGWATSAAVEYKRCHPHQPSLARALAGVCGWMGAFHA
jgi:hypothetical protein